MNLFLCLQNRGNSGHDRSVRKILKHTVHKVVRIFHAFSLIEILIVVGILGVLAVFSTRIGWTYVLRARDIQRKDDLERLRISVDDAYDTFGFYPPALPECGFPFKEGNLVFAEFTPCDPKTDGSYRYITDGTETSRWYKLYANLEYTQDFAIDYVGCRTGCGPSCQYNYGIASTNIEVMGCSELVPTLIPSPSPMPILFACAPGGGQEGVCEEFDDPERSECPKAYPDDPTCLNECALKVNKCKNASGKHKPE